MSEQQPFTILNVDDNEANRYVVTRILEKAGFEVKQAATGGSALALAAEKPDLIILDIKLPDINGFEVCRRLKTNPATASIPVLQMSARFVKSEDKVQGLEGGADGYLTQPIEPLELIATVKALLRMRQAEEAVRVSARQWETTFNAISDGVFLMDMAGRVLRCNQAWAGILKMPSHEIIGRTCQELVQFMPNPVADSHFMQILENPWHTTDLAIGDRWFHVTVNLVLDESGNPSGAVYVMSDITERKWVEEEIKKLNQDLEYHVIERTAQLEAANQELEKEIIHRKRSGAALRESQQMLQFVMDNIPQFIFWKDQNSVFLGCNRNYAQLAGVSSPENIIGKTDYDLPWKEEEANWFRECDRRIMETDTPEYHIIEPALRADGKQAWLDTNKVPLHDPEGNVVGILGTFEDITERKQAEAALSESQRKLATLIDSLPGIVFSCTNDSERSLTYLSEGCLTLTGYTSEELVANGLVPYSSIIHAQDLPKIFNAIETAIALKQPYIQDLRKSRREEVEATFKLKE